MTDFNLAYAPCFYFCTTDDGIILDVNETLCTKLEFEKAALIGKKQDTIFTIATRIFQQTHLFPLLKIKNNADEILITLQTKTKNQLSVLFNIERKLPDGKAVIQYVGIQVAQRKEYEERLLLDKKLAESALFENTALNDVRAQLHQKLAALDEQINLAKKQASELKQFNKVVTHDLEEPLRKLSIFSGMLSATKEPEQINKITASMMEAATKTKRVISGLQQYIWLSEATLYPVELNIDNFLEGILDELAKQWPGVTFKLEKETIPVLHADRDQLVLLLTHLLSNVIRFRKPGNHASAKLSAKSLQLNKFLHTEEKYEYADYVRIEIKDDGIGFDEGDHEQAFDLFRTLHDTSGEGIGLALCKMIVGHHDGSISIASSGTVGTTITFTLPVNKH